MYVLPTENQEPGQLEDEILTNAGFSMVAILKQI